MKRVLVHELLDSLPPASPRAMRARSDLRRLNALMGHPRIMAGLLRRHFPRTPPHRIGEMGAGDGRFLFSVAQRLFPAWQFVETTAMDQHPIIAPELTDRFRRINWPIEVQRADAWHWLQQPGPSFEALIANLFLHHFSGEDLSLMLNLVAYRTRVFLALEPRRSLLSLCFSRMVGLVGCNDVTRHDAPVSVRAGFIGCELSALWREAGWQLEERPVGLFSHCFIARKPPAQT